MKVLLNISDNKASFFLEVLKNFNYVSVAKLKDDALIVSETEKNIMRERQQKAKPADFKDWNEIKNSFTLR